MAEPSSQKLADVLRSAGFPSLAERAERDEFHDYRSSHPLPVHMLIGELERRSGPAARAVIQAILRGEFDASRQEAERWSSPIDSR